MIARHGLSGASAPKSSRGRPLSAKTLEIRDAIEDLSCEHDVMTVRGIFYALVSRGVIPKTEDAGYRPVQKQVLRMRKDGLLPWEFVADSTRWQRKPESWQSVSDAVTIMQRSYRRNLWQSQSVRIEVWLEKDALAAVVMQATEPWDVSLMVSRGTSSATFLHEAATQAERAWEREAITTVIFALYDYDAAGQRAARSVETGLREYAPTAPIVFTPLAVTEEQIENWRLPTRPAKRSDPEAHRWGDRAVELDAIPPDELLSLVDGAIREYVDPYAWALERQAEESERAFLRQLTGDQP